MRLSRPRLALRAALLTLGGGYMLWRAVLARRASGALEGNEALLGSSLAVVWFLVGVLALVTAASVTLSLRRKPPKRTLHLRDLTGDDAARAPVGESSGRESVSQRRGGLPP